jgi:hypothetical protein
MRKTMDEDGIVDADDLSHISDYVKAAGLATKRKKIRDLFHGICRKWFLIFSISLLLPDLIVYGSIHFSRKESSSSCLSYTVFRF